MSAPFIEVVVPTYNRCAMLDRLIASLLNQSYPADRYRLIVVDDGSSDETWKALETWAAREPRVKPLHIQHGGASAARNHGWRSGTADIIAFTDDDCVADRQWLHELARGFAERPQALGFYGKTLTEPAKVTPLTYQIVAQRPNSNYRTCNIAYRRKSLIDAEGFDEKSAYGEDAQLAADVLTRGPILFWPAAIMIHPPRPRIFLDADAWQIQLEGLFRLYSRQPMFFRRHWGRYFPIAVAWRLGIGSTAKQALSLRRWIARDPALYGKFLRLLIRERSMLLKILPRFWHAHRKGHGGIQTSEAGGPAGSRNL